MYRIKRKVKINGVVRTVHCMVIPEKKQVIANIRGCSMDAIEGFVKDTGFAPLEPVRFFMNDVYKATANCHPDDEFNPEVGANIAVEKLSANYCEAYERKIDSMLEYMDEHLTTVRWKTKNQ